MKSVITCLPLKKRHKQMLEQVSTECVFCHLGTQRPTKEQLSEANVVIGNLPPALLADAPKLELLQLNSAGTDGYTVPGLLPEGAKLANASGAYGLAISEHMVGCVLALMKKLPLYLENQKQHQWKDEGPVRSVYGSRTLVVGMGDIGSEFARRMNAMGSEVIGVRRHAGNKPDYVAEVCTMERLDEELEKADIIACSLPGTPSTCHLFDEERIRKMKRGAILVNVGRGTLIDPEVLAWALTEGYLGGACVDVTEPEPLPADSVLWNAPNLILTPHVSGGYHLEITLDRIVEIAARNLKAVCEGGEIVNEVDCSSGYRKLENRHRNS
ncbi:MAG: D-2-hydroxyacid dehydrogenase [Fusicatenibacter sp.]